MTNLEAGYADGSGLGFLQQHRYVPKVLRRQAMPKMSICVTNN